MVIQFDLRATSHRLMWCGAILAMSLLFVGVACLRFVIAVVADPRIKVSQETLEAAVQQFPKSDSLRVRLAARLLEGNTSQNGDITRIAHAATFQSSTATQLAPWKYESWMLLSAARELSGDLAQAETDMRTALTRAPQRATVHWQLANLLVRVGKVEAALPEFRTAIDADPRFLSPTLPLLWQATKGDVARVAMIVQQEPAAQMTLAKFLAQQSQAAAVVEILQRLNRQTLLKLPETGKLLDTLIAAKEVAAAKQSWYHLFGAKPDGSTIWNGSFELDAPVGLHQFDWQLADSRYARLRVMNNQARTGNRALALEYRDVETTRLDQEIKQLITVRPGLRYRLECYAKASSLVTDDGPRVVISKMDAPTIIAETSVVAPGTHDWELLTVDFVAPAGTSALLVTIKQTPRFSYAKPTSGTVWFDDLSVQER